MKPFFDRILSFTISKKLTVFLIATIFLYLDKLLPNQWVNVAMIYIGTQGVIDIIVQLRQSSRRQRNRRNEGPTEENYS